MTKKTFNITNKVVIDPNKNGNCHAMVNITNGKIYASQYEAAKDLNCTVSAISHSLKEGSGIVRGCKLCWAEDMAHYAKEIFENIENERRRLEAVANESNARLEQIRQLLK